MTKLFSIPISGSIVPCHGPARRSTRMIEAERLFNRPWAISKAALAALVAEYIARSTAVQIGDDDDQEDFCPYLLTDDGIACIPVVGPLTKARYWRGTSYGDVGIMCAHALANSSVKALLLCFDSPGGEVSGMFELTEYLRSVRGQKPTAGISDDNCYSAAYCLAATTDKLFVTQTGGTGSVGCWTAHVDYSKMLSMDGIVITYVFSGAKKVDGNPAEPLPDRVRADMQEETDRIRAMFVQSVASNRGVSADALLATEAGVFMAEKGIPLLCDSVGTIEDALTYLRGRIPASEASIVDDQTVINTLPGSEDDDQPNASELKIDKALAQFSEARASAIKQKFGDSRMSGDMPACLSSGLSVIKAKYGEDVEPYVLRYPELRSESSKTDRKVTMTLVPYGHLSSDLGGFREIYQQGCFSEGLANNPCGLFSHDPRYVLGDHDAGTARFREDADGVHAEFDLPQASWADDLLVSMRRGDISGASAAFFILKQRWELRDGERVRIVERALLREGSVHKFPAYESTLASAPPAAEAVAAAGAGTEVSGLDVTELDGARLRLLKLR